MDANNQGFHGIQHVAFQQGPSLKDDVLNVQSFSKHTLEVPEILGKVENVPVTIVKDPPQSNVTLETFETTSNEYVAYAACAKDMAFILARTEMTSEVRKKNLKSNWIAINQQQSQENPTTKTLVGFMPLLHAPADNYSSLYTIFCRAIFDCIVFFHH